MTSDGAPSGPTGLRPKGKSTLRLWLAGFRLRMLKCLAWWRPIMLSLLLIAAVGWAAHLFYFDYRRDHDTDKAAAREVVRVASDGAVALLSYSPDSLSRDIDNAKSRVTSDFQASLKRFTEQVVTPAAQRAQVTTTVHVIRAAIAELHPDSAVVLLFIGQKTTSKERAEPVSTNSSVRVNLAKVQNVWLISNVDSL